MPRDASGHLVAGRLSAPRTVPASIPRPEYVGKAEPSPHTGGDVYDAETIETSFRALGAFAAGGHFVRGDLPGAAIAPGVTTDELDRYRRTSTLLDHGAYPSTLGSGGYHLQVRAVRASTEVICPRSHSPNDIRHRRGATSSTSTSTAFPKERRTRPQSILPGGRGERGMARRTSRAAPEEALPSAAIQGPGSRRQINRHRAAPQSRPYGESASGLRGSCADFTVTGRALIPTAASSCRQLTTPAPQYRDGHGIPAWVHDRAHAELGNDRVGSSWGRTTGRSPREKKIELTAQFEHTTPSAPPSAERRPTHLP